MNFKNNLKELRRRKGLKQQEIANNLKITLNSYQKYEQGERQPKYEILEQLTQILECDYNDLLK